MFSHPLDYGADVMIWNIVLKGFGYVQFCGCWLGYNFDDSKFVVIYLPYQSSIIYAIITNERNLIKIFVAEKMYYDQIFTHAKRRKEIQNELTSRYFLPEENIIKRTQK